MGQNSSKGQDLTGLPEGENFYGFHNVCERYLKEMEY